MLIYTFNLSYLLERTSGSLGPPECWARVHCTRCTCTSHCYATDYRAGQEQRQTLLAMKCTKTTQSDCGLLIIGKMYRCRSNKQCRSKTALKLKYV